MVRLKWMAFIAVLLSVLACRAAGGISQAEPTVTAYPSATMRPLPTITLKPAGPSGGIASPTPVPPVAEPTEAILELPEGLPTEMNLLPTEIAILPMGTPYLDDSFRGVPVMPGALNPSEDNDTLTFTTPASVADVLNFYQGELEADGWEYLGGDVETPESKMMIYTKGDKIATIAIMPSPTNPAETMVFIAVAQ